MISGVERFYHFSYLRIVGDAVPKIHELRDGHAFAELAMVVANSVCPYGGLLLNYLQPSPHISTPVPTEKDLVVLTTRPPLSDDPFWARSILRSDSELEKTILSVVRQSFATLSRETMVLTESMAALLPEPYKDRGEIVFYVNGAARYKRHRRPYTRVQRQWHEPAESLRTSAFILCSKLASGAVLLNAFSMDGPTTLAWCYLIRTRFANLIDSPRFVMVEIEASEAPPEQPPSLSFVDDWKVEILLNVPLS